MLDPELSKRENKKKSSTREEKKKKRKRKSQDDENDMNVIEGETQEPPEQSSLITTTKEDRTKNENDDTKKKHKPSSLSKEERKAKKAKKKAEKEELQKKVPKTDEQGIAYTKAQIKRMVKRVKRGLNPVPTEEEERERLRQIKLDKREEELELAGMLYNKEDDNEDDNDDDNGDDDGDGDNKDQDEDSFEENEQEMENEDVEESGEVGSKSLQAPPKPQQQRPKKKARTKAVPPDYICMACQNKHSPLHWIYDCPDKICKPGSNQVKKKLRGIQDPASRKVFISGLPFDAKTKDVEMYFEKEMGCGKVVHCKLLQFEDTKRCKGTGFLTFETDEGAKNALRLNGKVLNLSDHNGDKRTKNSGNVVEKKKQKELRLGVKKLLNRTITKRSKVNS